MGSCRGGDRGAIVRRETVITAFSAVVLGGWWVLTALHQMKRVRTLTSRFDRYGAWLPLWTFFGPIPGTLDAEMLVRYTRAGVVGEWTHLRMYEPRRWTHMIIHPNRRLEKTMFDAISDIKRQLGEEGPPERITGTFAYAVLLSIVTSEARTHDVSHAQFMVVNSGGADDNPHSLVPLFASAVHPV